MRPASHQPAASRTQLIAGMQLLRAVSTQSVRLQLAMLKRGRRPTIESLDSLAAMDRELEHFIEGIGPDGFAAPELEEIAELVALQKTALANEKIALMAEISGPDVVSMHMPIPAHETAPEPAPGPEPAYEPAEYRASGVGAKIAAIAAMGVLAGGGALAWRYWETLATLAGL